MSEVVEFKKPEPKDACECGEPLVWVCLCGCTTWHALSDGGLECAGCRNISTDGPSGWRAHLPDDQEGTVEDTWRVVGGAGVEFWLKRYAKPGIHAAMIVGPDGKAVTWTHNITDDERKAMKAAIDRL